MVLFQYKFLFPKEWIYSHRQLSLVLMFFCFFSALYFSVLTRDTLFLGSMLS